MKKSSKFLMAAALVAGLSAPVQAADMDYSMAAALSGLYVRGDIGASFLEWDGGNDDTAFAFGAGLGWRFNDYLRADVRYSRAGKFKIGGGTDLTASSVLGNIYFDLPLRDMPIRPYLGAGLGYGWATFSPGADDSGLAAAFMAGFSASLTPNMDLDIGYRFHDIMVSGPDITDHQLLVGLRYMF